MTLNPLTGRPFSKRYWEIQEELCKLPILTHKQQFLEALDQHQILILVGDDNKSTQVPQWCLEHFQQKATEKPLIGCTQPRRVSAISLAQQVSDELDTEIGEYIGYSIRFEDKTSTKTSLKYCTDGLLLREMLKSPLLESYNAIVVDEVQERTIGTDILLSLLKGIIEKRKDFKLVIMSGSGKVGKVQKYFDCPLIEVGKGLKSEKSPEICRKPLNSMVLQLKKIGVKGFSDFNFIDQPSQESVQKAIDELTLLGAFDEHGELTEIGSQMIKFPLEPRMSKVLVTSLNLGCNEEILSIISMLSRPNDFLDSIKSQFIHPSGDHLTLLNIYQSYKADPNWCKENGIDEKNMKRVDQIREQLKSVQEQKADGKESSNVQKALLSGHILQLAHLEDNGKYRTLHDRQVVSLHSTTTLSRQPEWVIYDEMTNENEIRTITEVTREWILEMAPMYKGYPAMNKEKQ